MATSTLRVDLLAGGRGRPALSPRGTGALTSCVPIGDGYLEDEYLLSGLARHTPVPPRGRRRRPVYLVASPPG